MIFVKLAWRNLFRNKRRSFIAGFAVGIGLASLIFIDALMLGMEKNMIISATASYLGEGQIHRAGFRQAQEVEMTIAELDRIVAGLKEESIVKNFTVRTTAFGILTSPSNISSIGLVGIDPETEQYVSEIDEAIVEGSYFAEKKGRDILMGTKLAEVLEVGLGDRVVITVAQAGTGDLLQELFRVSGIFRFNILEMDRAMVFIRLPKAQEMLGIGNNAHEIAISFTDISFGKDETLPFWEKYSQAGNEAIGWTKIIPQLKAAFKLSEFSVVIAAIILFSIVALGIINTLFMSLYERMFEFGILRSVGTRPFKIAQLIMYEAGALAIVGIGFGIMLGFISVFIVSKTGIDYTGIEFAGVTFRRLLYPTLTMKQFIYFPAWVFIFTIFASFYPAVYAARMKPVEAMRKSI